MAVWRGPRRVVRLESRSILELENMIKGTRPLVHISHVKPYVDSHRGQELEMEAVTQHLEHEVFTIRDMLDLRFSNTLMDFEILCEWRGYSKAEAPWEPVTTLRMDCPQYLESFLQKFPDQELVTRLREN